MMSLNTLLIYIAAATLLAVTPGPGLFYVAARTLSGGRAEGISSSLGTALGGMVHILAGALGISALVLASAALFTALKFVGALYLVWIGLRTIQQARRDGDAVIDQQGDAVGARRAFREGILVEAMNPKTAAFFLAFIPQFVDPHAGLVALQFILLGALSVFLNTVADIAVVFGAAGLRQKALSRPALIGRVRQVSGGAMVALGIGLAFARRPAA